MLFYIRIELDRSNVDGRSFQAQPDKMLHFQSLAGFQRICSKLPNFPESIENTGQNGFLGFADNSSHALHSVYHACSPIFGRIHDAYLYGSYARGDFNPESDIDILLTVDLEQAEIAKHRNDVAKVTSRLSLEHDITVSVTVKPLEQFRRYQTALPYYRNVVREGIRYAGT